MIDRVTVQSSEVGHISDFTQTIDSGPMNVKATETGGLLYGGGRIHLQSDHFQNLLPSSCRSPPRLENEIRFRAYEDPGQIFRVSLPGCPTVRKNETWPEFS